MPFQDSTNLNSRSKYIVDPNGDTPYASIQSALDAANTAGVPATVYVRGATYLENLTCYSGIDIVGENEQATIITGTHTLPAAGTLNLFRCTFRNAVDVFNSAVAGTTDIIMEDCSVDVLNGYTFNLVNWTGSISIFDIGNVGTNDGFINNTGGAAFSAYASGFGNGVGNTMNISGATIITTSECACPVDFQGASTVDITNSSFTANVTTSATATVAMKNGSVSTGAVQAITHGSANETSLSNVSIDSSNVVTIGGAGAGNLQIGEITFLDTSAIAGTLTVDRTPVLTTGVARTTVIEAIGEGAGAQNVIDITPAAAIGAVAWNGIYIDGTALDPTGAAEAYGINIDLSGTSIVNDPELIGIDITMPAVFSGDLEKCALYARGFGYEVELCSGDHEGSLVLRGQAFMDYDATALAAGETLAGFQFNVDETGSTGGELHVLNVSTTGDGTADIVALGTSPEVAVVHQHVGVFAATDQSWKENGGFTDTTAAFDNPGVDVTIFDGDNDYIYIGSNAVFSQIRAILATVATRNIFPIFEYSIGGPAWTVFTPTDGTTGFTQSGIIEWDSAALAGWASVVVNGANHFYIRIQRTRNNIGTIPIEDTIRILEPTLYYWNEDGEILAAAVTAAGANFTICDAATFDTNVAAAAVQLSGTTLSADGTDANIDVSITPKGTGVLLTPAIGNAADITAIAITAAGEVTMPLQPAFLAYLGAGDTDSDVTGNAAAYTFGSGNALTEVFDQNADFNTNGTLTAPVTGRYLLTYKAGFNPMTAGARVKNLQIITSNRTIEYQVDFSAVGGSEQAEISIITDMDAADTATYQLTVSGEVGNTVDILGAADLRNAVSGCLLA